MDNFVYILCKQPNVYIKRLHICTWELRGSKFFTEYGLELNRSNLKNIDLQMVFPSSASLKESDFGCLYKSIRDVENSRFIFNSNVESITPINGNPEFGSNVSFSNERKITVLPLGINDNVEIDTKFNTLKFGIDTSNNQICEDIYIRFLVHSDSPSFSFEKQEITKKLITYDVRVNECRTAPQSVIGLQKKGYCPVRIEKCFCFHIIPNTYNIDFIDNKKLKTVRGLESMGFNGYLTHIPIAEGVKIKDNEYKIVFSKQEGNTAKEHSNYSFFSTFSRDYIGNRQIGLAIGANILCSLLFAISDSRDDSDSSDWLWYLNMPIEYYVAIVILFFLCCYFIPFGSIWRFFRSCLSNKK